MWHAYERFPTSGHSHLGCESCLSFSSSSFPAALLLRKFLELGAAGRLPTGGPSMNQVMCPIIPVQKGIVSRRWPELDGFDHMGTDGLGSPALVGDRCWAGVAPRSSYDGESSPHPPSCPTKPARAISPKPNLLLQLVLGLQPVQPSKLARLDQPAWPPRSMNWKPQAATCASQQANPA